MKPRLRRLIGGRRAAAGRRLAARSPGRSAACRRTACSPYGTLHRLLGGCAGGAPGGWGLGGRMARNLGIPGGDCRGRGGRAIVLAAAVLRRSALLLTVGLVIAVAARRRPRRRASAAAWTCRGAGDASGNGVGRVEIRADPHRVAGTGLTVWRCRHKGCNRTD